MSRAVAAGAEAAIFNVYRGDEAGRWDVPDQRAALRDLGIPSLYLAEQPHAIADPVELRSRIGDFIAGLPAGRPATGTGR